MLRALRVCIMVLLLPCMCFAQTSESSDDSKTIRVGVANLQNRTTRSFNAGLYRSQLVRFLNDFGDQKKEPIVVEAIALNATSRKSASSEAASKGCQYLLLTTVRDFSGLGSVGVGDGGITAIPGVSIGTAASGDRRIIVEFEAARIGRLNVVSQGSLQPTNSPRADEQITELVQMEAMRVAHDLRKDRVDWREGE